MLMKNRKIQIAKKKQEAKESTDVMWGKLNAQEYEVRKQVQSEVFDKDPDMSLIVKPSGSSVRMTHAD